MISPNRNNDGSTIAALSASGFAASRTVVFIILAALAVRGSLLEYTDLIDPTESRYAVIASEMVHSHRWLTPTLPMPEGVVPYLGKPPLHFWMTALSYSVKLGGTQGCTAYLATSLTCLYLVIIVSISPYVNIRRSCEAALNEISLAENCHSHEKMHQVGVASRNAYSHYWAADAWENELAAPVKIFYVAPEAAAESDVCHYLIKVHSPADVHHAITDNFVYVTRSGDWLIYARKDRANQNRVAMLGH